MISARWSPIFHIWRIFNIYKFTNLNFALNIDGEIFRATARVVRIFDLPGGIQLAVVFESIPVRAQEALSELTLRIQDALI